MSEKQEISYSANEEGIYIHIQGKLRFTDWQTIINNSVEVKIKTPKGVIRRKIK